MKKGFTLIELLVVVLIIGILAAIALPQYTKAVEKSRISEAITILNALYKDYKLCVLENGVPDGNNLGTNPCDSAVFFENLTIEAPGTKAPAGNCDAPGCSYTKNWQYDYDEDNLTAYRLSNGNINSTVPYDIKFDLSDGKIACWDNEVADSCKKICGSDGCELK